MTMMPGSPQILNIMPTKYMASSTMSAPLLGILGAIVVAAFNVFYFKYQLKKAKARGEGYVAPSGVGCRRRRSGRHGKASQRVPEHRSMIVVVIMLNAFKLDAVWALLGGVAFCIVFFWKYFKNLPETLNKGPSTPLSRS